MAQKVITVIPAKIEQANSPLTHSFKKRRVAAYARVSTDSDEQATSYEAQVTYYTQKITENPNWEFVKVYADDGVSGLTTNRRTGFNEMIKDALGGKIDLIITKSISRFARNTVDTLTSVRQLKEVGCEVFFEKENIHTFDGSGEMLITIMSSLAQEESRSMSENIKWGHRRKFAEGKVPFAYGIMMGYRKGADGKPEIIPNEAAIIRKIYDLYLSGLSYLAIAKQLTSEGIITPMGKNKWSGGSVELILKNEKYKGDALLQKTYIPDYLTKRAKKNKGEVPQYYVKNNHPAIVNPEVYDRVQREIARRKRMGNKYKCYSIYSGRIKCGDCGKYYGRKVWGSNTKWRRIVWQCNYKFKNANHCLTPHLEEEEIEQGFLLAFNQLIENKEVIIAQAKEIARSLKSSKELHAEKEALIIQMDKISNEIRNNNTSSFVIPHRTTNVTEIRRTESNYNEMAERVRDIDAKIKERNEHAACIEAMIRLLSNSQHPVSEFNIKLWYDSVDTVTVFRDRSIIYLFQDGTEIAIRLDSISLNRI